MLDKFIGDAIMAAFGLPIPHDDDEDRAVRAAISMIRSLWRLERRARESKGKMPVDMGIGLNTDKVVSGNIGSPKRMDYTHHRRRREPRLAPGERLQAVRRAHPDQREHLPEAARAPTACARSTTSWSRARREPVGVYEVLDYHTDETLPEPDGRGEPLPRGPEALSRRPLGQGGPRLRGMPQGQRRATSCRRSISSAARC